MGIRLDDKELEEFLTQGHTLILATTRKSGEPFLTALWYVYHDGSLYFRSASRSAKVKHIKADHRVCCMVEEGERWIDLKAATLSCDAQIVEDEVLCSRISELIGNKYRTFGAHVQAAPKATRNHYAASMAVVKLTPRSREVRSWYNRKIRGMEALE